MIVGNMNPLAFAGAGTLQAYGPNPRRVGLIVSMPNTASIHIAFGEPAANLYGLRFNAGAGPPFQIVFDSPNDWITQSISVQATGALTACLIELVDRQP